MRRPHDPQPSQHYLILVLAPDPRVWSTPQMWQRTRGRRAEFSRFCVSGLWRGCAGFLQVFAHASPPWLTTFTTLSYPDFGPGAMSEYTPNAATSQGETPAILGLLSFGAAVTWLRGLPSEFRPCVAHTTRNPHNIILSWSSSRNHRSGVHPERGNVPGGSVSVCPERNT